MLEFPGWFLNFGSFISLCLKIKLVTLNSPGPLPMPYLIVFFSIRLLYFSLDICIGLFVNVSIWLFLIYTYTCFTLQKKVYKIQAEAMLVTHVFPEFQSPQGYLRAMVRIIMVNLASFHGR